MFYGTNRDLEYDLVVSPGSDPGQIKLGISGAENMRIDGNGNLVLKTGAGAVIQQRAERDRFAVVASPFRNPLADWISQIDRAVIRKAIRKHSLTADPGPDTDETLPTLRLIHTSCLRRIGGDTQRRSP